jgi:zinc transport system substrate-binding protein
MKRILFICLFVIISNNAFARSLKILTSIKPVESIVSFISGDKNEISLLLKKNHSLHDYTLKPSDASLLYESDLIFFIDTEMEVFMKNIIENAPNKESYIALSKNPNLKILAGREELIFEEDEHHEHNHSHETDYHIWLDTDNAINMAKIIEQILSEKDSENSHYYKSNLKQFIKLASELDEKLKKDLGKYKNYTFIVFHDAYQYFEKKYNLTSHSSLMLHSYVTPSAEKLSLLKNEIKKNKISCLFKEPGVNSKFIDLLAKNDDIKIETLDGEWGIFDETKPKRLHYFLLMEGLANSFIKCFH